MDYRKLPVAKRTRLSNDKRLMEQYYAKRAKTEPDVGVVSESPVEFVDLDLDSDEESISIANNKGESSITKRRVERSNVDDRVVGGKLTRDCHASSDDVQVVDNNDGGESLRDKYGDLVADEEWIGIKNGESSDSRRCAERASVDGYVVGEKLSIDCHASNDDDVEAVDNKDWGESLSDKDVDLADEESIGIKKGESSDLRSCAERSNVDGYVVGGKLKKDCHASNDDDNNDGDESLSNKNAGLDFIVISDGEEEGEGDGKLVTDGGYAKVDNGVDEELSDSSSEDDTEESEDETYGEESDHDESLDESSSSDKMVDERKHDLDADDEIECCYGLRHDLKWKAKGKLADEGQRANKSVKRRKETVDERFRGKFGTFEPEEQNSCTDKSNDDDEDDSDEEDRTVESGFKKRIESQNVANGLRPCSSKISKREEVNIRKYGPSILEADFENGEEYGKKDGEERRKNMRMTTKRKTDKNLNYHKILVDSLLNEEEGLENFVASDEPANLEKKLEYKFWYPEKKPVEKSEFDEELEKLFALCQMSIAAEDIGSASPEVDNGDHSKTPTDCCTQCQSNNHLVLDEQIGIICKYCSIVLVEIKNILPPFKKPSPQRRRNGYFVQLDSSSLSDHFQDTGAEKYGFEDCNTSGTVWDLVPGTRRSMYEHQREGFEFIWKNLAGGTIIQELEIPLSSSGTGCIISHAPGTGKTRLTIVFLQSFMKLYPDSRPVIIAPKSMLLTWEEEFRKWNINIPFHNMNSLEFSGHENPAAVHISKKIRGSRNNESVTRVVKLLSWKMGKSILGITYALFDKLVRGETRNADCTPTADQMGKALLKFPTVLILDEGHNPRNDQSFIYNSLRYVETKRRVILSGTPFQNNFTELYNTLRLVNPKFNTATKKNLRKISKELKSKWSIQKLRELKAMINPFVHVHKGKILQESCPGLKNALIHLQLTDLQQELITVLSTNELRIGYLDLSHAISLVSVHPSLLPDRCFHEHQFSIYRDRLERLRSDPYSGAKTKFVLEFCRLTEALNEKVLIYSQYIDPLMFIKEQLRSHFRWTEGREVLYMDGSLEAKQRQSSISALNDPKSKVRVLLASIKACSEGIHLVGASRVVLLDVVWNPSVERQAISRAYRIGQKNVVYTYHLIAEEMEFQKYKVQTAKDQLSEMVFSSKEMDSCRESMPNIVSEDKILHEMFQRNEKLGSVFSDHLCPTFRDFEVSPVLRQLGDGLTNLQYHEASTTSSTTSSQ
ncbi:SNF2 domain-containing protein CLASSY 4-like [Heracleum sosnowskyi]|uniref:SNF2 domain-containing protein CLASSY 4-like n=1 Tax=Heracleum sosnowskyi TaxID=360622 RepID=A0AAD8HRU0_9APIA|nr:SNF2 domain-containing protein CLASSY 4-like [Heracleum sosnowskyi]